MAEPKTKAPRSGSSVRVRNLLQRRPVLMNLPGGASLRLGPGETAEIDELHAQSRECVRYCRDGMLRIEGAKPKPKPDEAEAEAVGGTVEDMTELATIDEIDPDAGRDPGKADKGEEPARAGMPEPQADDADAKTEAKPSEGPGDEAGAKAEAKPAKGRKDEAGRKTGAKTHKRPKKEAGETDR